MPVLREGNSHKKQTTEIKSEEDLARQHPGGNSTPFQRHLEDLHQRRRRNGRRSNVISSCSSRNQRGIPRPVQRQERARDQKRSSLSPRSILKRKSKDLNHRPQRKGGSLDGRRHARGGEKSRIREPGPHHCSGEHNRSPDHPDAGRNDELPSRRGREYSKTHKLGRLLRRQNQRDLRTVLRKQTLHQHYSSRLSVPERTDTCRRTEPCRRHNGNRPGKPKIQEHGGVSPRPENGRRARASGLQ